jgi:hypothetical protein
MTISAWRAKRTKWQRKDIQTLASLSPAGLFVSPVCNQIEFIANQPTRLLQHNPSISCRGSRHRQ